MGILGHHPFARKRNSNLTMMTFLFFPAVYSRAVTGPG